MEKNNRAISFTLTIVAIVVRGTDRFVSTLDIETRRTSLLHELEHRVHHAAGLDPDDRIR